MKKVLFAFIGLILSLNAFSQTGSLYLVPSISALKAYYGVANTILVTGTYEFYTLCNTCVVNETSVYAGVGNRRWERVTEYGSGSITVSDYFDNGKTYDGLPLHNNAKAARYGDVLYGILDDYTGESFTYNKITDTAGIALDSVMVCKKNGEVFRRSYTGNLNVKWFGAKGDGIRDNTKSMQAAMNYLAANGGGVMHIPYSSKTYKLDSLLLKFTVSIEGDGGETSLEANPSSASGLMIMDASPITGVHYSGFRLIANSANTSQHGWNMTATGKYNQYKTGGIWYSSWKDVTVINFAGHGFHFVALDDKDEYPNNDIANQFLFFNNVNVFAPNSATTRALYAEGQFGQVVFTGCEFDGTNNHNMAGSMAIELLSELYSGNGTDHVYSVTFDGTTVQSSDIGIKTYYASVAILNCHFERLRRQVYATGTSRVRIDNTAFSSPSTVYTGTQYMVRNESSFVDFTNNMCTGGNLVSVNGYSMNIRDIRYADASNPQVTTSGCTIQAGVRTDSSINVYGNKSFLVNTSATPIKKLNSLQAGNDAEITLTAFAGPLTIRAAVDGNISMPAHYGGKIDMKSGDMITFKYMDLGTRQWYVKSVSGTPVLDTTNTYYTRYQLDQLLLRKTNKRDLTIQMSLTAGTDTLSTGSTSDILLNLNNDTLRNINSTLAVGDVIRIIGVNGSGRQTVITTGGNITTIGYEDGTGSIVLRVGEIVTLVRENLLSTWQVSSAKTAKYAGILPTVGTYFKGEVIYNKNYDGSNNRLWVCTATGDVGTWVPSDQLRSDSANVNLLNVDQIVGSNKSIDVGKYLSFYNTNATFLVNYERARAYWDGANVFHLGVENGGTGLQRGMQLDAANIDFRVGGFTRFILQGASIGGSLNIPASIASNSTVSILGMTGNVGTTSGTASVASILNTITQTGSAGYRGLWIAPYEASLGSATSYLISAGTSSAATGGGTYTQKFGVTNAGAVSATSFRVSSLQTAPATMTDVGSAGEVRVTATGIFWCIATNSWLKISGSAF